MAVLEHADVYDGVALQAYVYDTVALKADVHDTAALQVALAHAARLRRPSRAHFVLKRAIDITTCVLLVPLLLPALAVIALAIKLNDGGPVLFSQLRTGRHGSQFRMYKFRTMVVDPDASVGSGRRQSMSEWFTVKPEHDPRITTVGRFLRRLYLDELPQLVNILKGEMSLVGPRPFSLAPGSFELWQTERFEATPGLTGLWQTTAHRDELPFHERLRLDIRYLETRRITGDLRIMALTLRNALQRNGR